MLKIKGALIIFPILVLVLLVFGCNEQNAQVSEPEILIEAAEEEIAPESEVEVIARQGQKDRLPGSLKWGSIAMYKANEDFFADHPEGLKAVSSYNVHSTTTTVSSETGTGQEATGSGGGSSTTSVNTSGGGISTSVTVDGSLTMKETTTIDNGDGEWFNID